MRTRARTPEQKQFLQAIRNSNPPKLAPYQLPFMKHYTIPAAAKAAKFERAVMDAKRDIDLKDCNREYPCDPSDPNEAAEAAKEKT